MQGWDTVTVLDLVVNRRPGVFTLLCDVDIFHKQNCPQLYNFYLDEKCVMDFAIGYIEVILLLL